MGGLYPKMKVTALTMLVGVLAIAGTPLFSGWYSKDAILAQALGFGLVHQEHPSKPVRFVEGGESRQESVENALASLAPDTDLVAVHDAVRPFIDSELVEKVIVEAAHTGAAIVGIVPVDTVKRVHKNKIRATLPREHLVLAQTPQVFRFDLIRRAFEMARQDNFFGTDEASLIERLEQVEVSVVQGSDRNLKITKPTDMELARLFLSEETAGQTAS